METSKLPPIPIDYIVGHALTLKTDGKRRPYVDLINQWAEHEDMKDEGQKVISSITGVTLVNADNMPKELYPLYRKGEKAQRLIDIVRDIDREISLCNTMCTWAHVMRVMVDENILMANVSINRFDVIICGMIPGKGRDNVRKNGDYNIMNKRDMTYRTWASLTNINPTEATNRAICEEIVEKFKPILSRNNTALPAS